MTDNRTTERVDHSPRVRKAIDELMREKDATDNRTNELRKLLTERGVECKPTKFSTLQTVFTANGIEWIVTEREATGELFVEPRHGLTPEQAIAATLGNGECELIKHGYLANWPEMVCWSCSACGFGWHHSINDKQFSHCPNCGRRVKGGAEGGRRMTEYIITCDDEVALWVGNDVESMQPLVRCRDCRFSLAHGNGCGRNQDIYDVEPDGFCAWAERKEGGE